MEPVKILGKTSVFTILFLSFIFQTVSAQDSRSFSFRHLYIEDGLSQSTILSVYQTSDHFLWLGTIDGLNRYDGYTIKVFNSLDNDTTSISDNYITSMVEDKRGFLWIGTKNNGLNRYDSRTGIFKRFIPGRGKGQSPSGKNIHDICIDYDGSIWIAYFEKGVDHFYPDSGKFINYLYEKKDKNSLPANTVSRIFLDRNNDLWFAAANGLARYDRKTKRFNTVVLNESVDLEVKAINQSKNGDIWVGTERGMLYRIKYRTLNVKKYKLPVNASRCSVRRILFHPYTNQVIIATYGFGLFFFDPQRKVFSQAVHDARKSTSLSNNHILDMIIDRSNVLWIGTLKGVNKIDLKPAKFALFRLKKENKKIIRSSSSPFDNFVTTIYKDPLENIWLGMYGNGLVKFNRQTGLIKQYTLAAQINTIWDILPDNEFYLWLAGDNGFIRFHRRTGAFHKIKLPKNFFEKNVIPPLMRIFKEKPGLLLLAFDNGRLIRYHIGNNTFEPVNGGAAKELKNIIFEIFRDHRGTIWLGTDGKGLYSYNPSTNSVLPFSTGIDSLKWIQRVNAIREDW